MAKASSTKKTAPKKQTAHASRSTNRKSHKKSVARPRYTNFWSINPTINTVYWLIIGVCAVVFIVWILVLTARIQAIYDDIDHTNNQQFGVLYKQVKELKG